MTPKHIHSSRAFTLWEVLVILLITAILVAILFPVYSDRMRPHGHQKQSQCMSNEKQIGLALMMYAQDYDDTYPPILSQFTLSDGTKHEQQWGIETSVIIKEKQEEVPGLISSYYTVPGILQCPASYTMNEVSYLYSDLAAGEPVKNFAAPANTVVLADSEDRLRNVGHARSQNSGGDEAVLRPATNGKTPKLLIGAAIGDALSRHSGGANYGFADGHVKWMEPGDVFFPPRNSASKSHRSHREAKTGKLLGPDPAGTRTFQGKNYTATFHVN